MQLFTLGKSKIEVFKNYFFDIVTKQNDHPTYVKHVFSSIYVFFTLFGYWVRGRGSSKGLVHTQLADAIFHPGRLKLIFLIW